MGNLQDRFRGRPELDEEFWLDRQWRALICDFIEPFEGSPADIFPHLPDVGGGAGPMKALRNWDGWGDMKQNEFYAEVIGEGDGAGQCVQGGGTEIGGEQKGPKWPGLLEGRILEGARADGQDEAIGAAKDLFRDGAEEHFPQSSATVCADDYQINMFLTDNRLQFFPDITLTDDEFVC